MKLYFDHDSMQKFTSKMFMKTLYLIKIFLPQIGNCFIDFQVIG